MAQPEERTESTDAAGRKAGKKVAQRIVAAGEKLHYFVVFRQMGLTGFALPGLGIYFLYLTYQRFAEGNPTHALAALGLGLVLTVGPFVVRRDPDTNKVYLSINVFK